MGKAVALSEATGSYERNAPAIGVFLEGDPRSGAESRKLRRLSATRPAAIRPIAT